MDHETNIQPEQAEKSAQIRLPCKNEDGGRPQGHPSSSQCGKSTTRCLNKSFILKKRFEFQSVKEKGTRLVGRFLCIDQKQGAPLRFGITVSKKYGNSPARNRFKRLVRESFRTARHLLPQDSELNISPRNYAKYAKMNDIQNEMLQLLK